MRAEVKDQRLPFDSILRGDTLTLVVHAILVPTFAGEVRRYRSQPSKTTLAWPPNLWDGWAAKWKELMLDAWHDKFQLQAAGALLRSPHPRQLNCHLELHVEGVDDTFQAPGHLKSRVDYFGKGARHFAVSSAALGGNSNRNAFDMTMDYRDIVGDNKGVAVQLSAVHEFGHHLGLGHRCHGTDDPYCTGGSITDRRDTMASGNDAKPWHAEPWLRRLHNHRYYQDENWWAVVKGESERSGAVRPGRENTSGNIARQDAMKQTAGLDAADIDSLIAPTSGATPRAARRGGFWASIRTALGLPVGGSPATVVA